MKEYIDRGALLKELERFPHLKTAGSVVRSMPKADVVEVVRCKDCKHATFYSCRNDACYRGIICEYLIGTDDENFFCGYGERKEQEDD
jgi:hypothetical protein